MSVNPPESAAQLLVVEDNPVDVRLLRYALDAEKTWKVQLSIAEDGEKAISVLLAGPRPELVILDLNLPKRSGTEVLNVIRHTNELKGLPVAILSSSPMDVIRGRVTDAHLEADWYFTKPMSIDEFVALGRQLHMCYEESRRT
jgi:DNA-binding response OmpR family regulator